jgi:hypothetical protein
MELRYGGGRVKPKTNDYYIAVIGDIKGSKALSDRDEIQKKLRNALDDINRSFSDDISSKFIITLGDEFQGLLCSGNHLMEIITLLEQGTNPAKLRFAIGIGRITTEINPEMALGADGPGYHKARQAIEYMKQNEKKNEAVPTDIRFESEEGYDSIVMLLNTVGALAAGIKEDWSDRQREIIWDMLRHQDNQVNAANRLGIKQPTIQKTLSKGKYYTYKSALESINKSIEEIYNSYQ